MTSNGSQHPSHVELKLLDVSLKHAGSIICSAMGDFTGVGGKTQEIAMLRAGGAVELYRTEESEAFDGDDEEDEEEETKVWLKLVTRLETKSILRSMAVVRLSGGKKDILVIGSDAGSVSLLDFEGGKCRVLHKPVFGKTGMSLLFFHL